MFSVLLSVYSGEHAEYLDQALSSIVHQTLMPAEIVLVKDGPLTDALEQVIDTYLSAYENLIKIVELPCNQGLGHALNEGLKACSFDWVARMDTDDIAKPNRFAKQMEVFSKYPDLDICSSWIEEFESSPQCLLAVKKVPEKHEEIIQYARHRCPVNHPAVMYRKHVVLEVGGYEGFPEDYRLWIKMILHGCNFYNIQESLLYFRFSRATIKRRGGMKYAISDVLSQWGFYKLGFLSLFDLVYNISVRSIVRLVPTNVRFLIYKKCMRR